MSQKKRDENWGFQAGKGRRNPAKGDNPAEKENCLKTVENNEEGRKPEQKGPTDSKKKKKKNLLEGSKVRLLSLKKKTTKDTKGPAGVREGQVERLLDEKGMS